MTEKQKPALPGWILIATGLAGLVSAIFVAAAKYYEVHKARAEAQQAVAATTSEDTLGRLAASVRAGSIWEGTFSHAGQAVPYPGSLVVAERTGDTFRGICSCVTPWGPKEKREIVSEVEGRFSGAEIAFRETKGMKGNAEVFAIPCVWKASVAEDRMTGTWWRTKDGNGTFEFILRKRD